MTILGIDLGTSHTVAAILDSDRARILRNQEGAPITPTIVSRTAGAGPANPTRDWHAGQAAKRLAVVHPRETVWDFVRLLGRRFDSPEVRNVAGISPFTLAEGPRGEATVEIGSERIHPAGLVAIVLAKLKAAAESETGGEVPSAVIAVPTPFHSGQRRLVAEAGRVAGFRAVRISASTTVAALALEPRDSRRRVVALADVGGGSVGIAIVEVQHGIFQVLSREWEPFLGGEDFDQLLVRWLVDELYRKERLDASGDPVILAHLKEAAEKAKRRLSVLGEVEVDVPLSESRLFTTSLARSELEAMLASQLEWLAAPCARALKSAGLAPSDVDALLPLGGSTRIPRVLQILSEQFQREPEAALHPEEAPALGAALLGGSLAAKIQGKVLLDVQSHDLGIEYPRGSFSAIMERGTSIPNKKSRLFMTSESRLEIHILEGTSPLAAENLSLGRATWELPFRRSESAVGVEIEVDVQGILQVTAVDAESGITHRVPLRTRSDLGPGELERYGGEVEHYLSRLLAEKVGYVTATRGLEGLDTAEKVMAALNGDRKIRFQLVRDPDRSVWSAVLESPKTTPEEAAAIAGLPDLGPEVLREISTYPEWVKRYEVATALVTNARTPAEIAMRLVDRLRTGDLERVIADERLPPLLRNQCRALMKMRV